ncbi:MAG TPA: regulatory iron-sulfur-containing complex subunit RicT [Phycisphaerae bacterium]|nr:regulatory iron-sulfur-containing complex subunit RicT [Phycisphaerae bacterium]
MPSDDLPDNVDEVADAAAKPAPGEQQRGGPGKGPPTVAVRYGRMRYVGEFTFPANIRLTPGRRLIVSTDRGIEVGEPLDCTCSNNPPCVSREQMREYARASGADAYQLKNGRVLRDATDADLVEMHHIERDCVEKLDTCQRFADEVGLQIKIVDCEHLFGGERIVFYFMAEHRVDFRELVRSLAGEYQTRIEMRQVGARDEARLLADYETCGRECCCRSFLKTLKPINMQMAKLQKATLDPAKVSGRCGRLKCCLRYEHEAYDTLVRRMPRIGSRVACAEGVGKVVDRQILTQLVRVLDDQGRLFTVPVEEITQRDMPLPPPPSDDEGEGRQGSRSRSSASRGSLGPRRGPATPRPDQRPTSEPRSPEPPNESGDALEGEDESPRGLDEAVPGESVEPPSDESGPARISPGGAPHPDQGEQSRPTGRRHHLRRRRGRKRGRGPGPSDPGHGGSSS